MRTIRFLLQKEFRQIFRNKAILVIVMVMPVIQLLVLPLAANYEVKNINIAVIDNDHSSCSRQLISKITASGYFRLNGYLSSYKEAMKMVESDKADLVLEIPQGFEKNLVRENKQQLFIPVNAINGTKANLGGVYLTQIIGDYNNDLRLSWAQQQSESTATIDITTANWFNPLLNYRFFMVPGILAVLVSLIASFLSALNIVKEKETGTIEQINVTPIKKYQFILGKLIPFWVLGLIVFTLGLLISWLIYGIVPAGNLILLYSFVAIYLLALLGFGLLISTYCETQQQAMFIIFFFIMIFILMGGLFTPIDSMPGWARLVTKFNPVSYLIEVMRMIILKGSQWQHVSKHLSIIVLFAIAFNAWAIWNYKKTS